MNKHASLRRMVTDLTEEYGRHTGHADLLRVAVDGRVGEDSPPEGWQPEGPAGDPEAGGRSDQAASPEVLAEPKEFEL